MAIKPARWLLELERRIAWKLRVQTHEVNIIDFGPAPHSPGLTRYHGVFSIRDRWVSFEFDDEEIALDLPDWETRLGNGQVVSIVGGP